MDTIAGLPAHPLFAHAAVTLIPLSSLLVLAVAFWPGARARIGIASPVLAFTAAVFAFLTKEAGEYLAKMADPQDRPSIHDHAEHGDVVPLWAIALLIVAVLLYGLYADRASGLRTRFAFLNSRAARITGSVLAVLVVIGAMWAVVAAGHSGSELVWKDQK